MASTIGIDLGTTYSVVAHASPDGQVEILPNERDKKLTPSVVYFRDDGQVEVGEAAKDVLPIEPDRVVEAIKRHMGTQYTLMFEGVTYTPEGISAVILRWLVVGAAEALHVSAGDLEVVITVPAYFGVAEREATAAAAKIAGIRCLDLVAEPVAAALSYGVDSGTQGSVLVYDLGGGTFDVTVIELTPDGPQPVVTDGSTELGGLKWDEVMAGILTERYVKITGDEDAFEDDDFLLWLAHQGEQLKRQLTTRESGQVTVERGTHRAKVVVGRDEFTAACESLIRTTLAVVDRALASATARNVSAPRQVILVGGSSRMPMIAESLRAHLGVDVALKDPDLAVAKGAAIHAQALVREREPKERSSSDLSMPGRVRRALAVNPLHAVVPRAVGVKVMDSTDSSGTRVFVQHLVLANARLPVVGATAKFATVMPDQERVRVEIYEQAGAVASEDIQFNRRVLDGELIDLPPLKAGSPIELTLSVALDGRLSCTAVEPRSRSTLVLESYVEGVVDMAEAKSQEQSVGALRLKR
jgi:molecular chaperone DnaK